MKLLVGLKLNIPVEVANLLIVFLLVSVFCLFTWYKVKKTNPLGEVKGIVLIAIMIYQMVDNYVDSLAGKKMSRLKPYIMTLGFLIFIANIWGLTGFEAPTSSLTVTLTLGIITILMTHIARFKRGGGILGYIKTYFEPSPFLLPLNIISAIAPLISISMRLAASIIAGSTILGLLYEATGFLGSLFGSRLNFMAPIITPVFHAYFDVFAGGIQAVVFITLTVIYISMESETE